MARTVLSEQLLKDNSHTIDESYATIVAHKAKPKLSKHCIATLIVGNNDILTDSEGFVIALQKILKKERVHCLGYINHNFPNDSFTTVVALSESHLSVHTWPERSAVQLDVFLCNYIHDNTQKCQRIFDAIVEYFHPIEVDEVYVERM